ncbi:MAG: hypothetical protein OEM42_02350 [Deltaproteobacteria bacterium]|nr:hypothetical protein [Deltaproteobacteria bacterium]
MKKTSCLMAVIAVLAFGLGGYLTGCGGGGGGGGGGAPPGVQGLEFTDQNMVDAAGVGAGVSSFITGFGGVTVDVLFGFFAGQMALQPTGVRPMVIVPLDICLNFGVGTASADWTDADLSLDLSTGDTVAVTFDNCLISDAALTGTVSFFFDSASLTNFPVGTADVTTTADLTVDDGVDTIAFTANFHMTYAGTLNTFDFMIGDGGVTELITFSDGVDTIQFGCFDTPLTFDVDSVLVSPRGIVNYNDSIVQLGDYGVSVDPNPLTFGIVGFDIAQGPYAGQLKELSFDDRPNQPIPLPACSAVGSTDHEGNTSLLVTATGGNPLGPYPVTIDRFDNTTWTPPPATSIDTQFWEDL